MLVHHPVIHVRSVEHAEEQARVAWGVGADGVFFIDHGSVGRGGLLAAYELVRTRHPETFVGISLLNGPPECDWALLDEALRRSTIGTAPEAWVDDAGPHPRGAAPESLQRTSLYGSVAFEYTSTFTEDPDQAARLVTERGAGIDVVTTSGAGTGPPPTAAELAAMKRAAAGQPLAVASGISAANLHELGEHVDEILVASSVETEPHSGHFDPDRLADLVDAAHREWSE